MRSRVRNPKRVYFGRFDIDPRWEDFAVFLADMGERPSGTTIERRDNTKGYWPDNCYWATKKQQRRNTKHCVYVTLDGERMLVIEALEKLDQSWGRYRYARWGNKKWRHTPQEAIEYLLKHMKTKHPDFQAQEVA
jgi:hypothetical protein